MAIKKKTLVRKVNVAANAISRHVNAGEKIERPAKHRMIPSPVNATRAHESAEEQAAHEQPKTAAPRPDGIVLHFGFFHI